MKIRKRFKKALFNFFEEEIKEELQLNKFSNIQLIPQPREVVHIGMEELRVEIKFDGRQMQQQQEPFYYERMLQDCKRKLFDKVMEYVVIDTKKLIDPHLYDARGIFMSIFVGKGNR